MEFKVPVELLREFEIDPRIVVRHPWVVGIPVPEFLIKEELLERARKFDMEVLLVPHMEEM